MSLRRFRSQQRFSVWATIAILVFQPQYLFAVEQSIVKSSTTAHVTQALAVADVAIQTDGLLRGQIVDRQGQPIAAAEIQLTDGRNQWRTQTDAKGHFQLAGLSGATYHLQVGQHTQLMRAWAAGTAPPSATKGLLLVQNSDVILAQDCGSPVCGSAVGDGASRMGRAKGTVKRALSNPWFVGGLVAAAIAIPLAVDNNASP